MATKTNHPTIDGESFNEEEDEVNESKNFNGVPGTKKRHGGSAVAAAIAKLHHPRSPYNASPQKSRGALPFPSRSHQSLPPPPRANPQGSSTSLGRTSIYGAIPEREVSYAQQSHTDKSSTSRVLKKLRRMTPQPDQLIGDGVPPNQLPEDLRKCLEVLESGVYEGHIALSDGLKKRYEEQYPLVRSLADVFVSNVRICFCCQSCLAFLSIFLVTYPARVCDICTASGTGS